MSVICPLFPFLSHALFLPPLLIIIHFLLLCSFIFLYRLPFHFESPQAKSVGIDGFLVEWGFRGHLSDSVLSQLIRVARRHPPFRVGVNWCDHWLKIHLELNDRLDDFEEEFVKNLDYLLATLSREKPALKEEVDGVWFPVIFLFGGGVNVEGEKFLKSISFKFKLTGSFFLPPSLPSFLSSFLPFFL